MSRHCSEHIQKRRHHIDPHRQASVLSHTFSVGLRDVFIPTNHIHDLCQGAPSIDDVKNMKMVRYCIAEALRLYPAPPLLIRRCLVEHHFEAAGFPDGITLKPGQDVMITTWSLHRDKRLWGEDAERFNPERFLHARQGSPDYQAAGWAGFDPDRIRNLYPDEAAADFGFLPFGGGNRKCVGDQFAMLESTVMLAKVPCPTATCTPVSHPPPYHHPSPPPPPPKGYF